MQLNWVSKIRVGGCLVADLWLVIVLTSAVCGVVGYVFAKKTGRNPVVWTTAGVVLNVVALLVLAMVGSRRRKQA